MITSFVEIDVTRTDRIRDGIASHRTNEVESYDRPARSFGTYERNERIIEPVGELDVQQSRPWEYEIATERVGFDPIRIVFF